MDKIHILEFERITDTTSLVKLKDHNGEIWAGTLENITESDELTIEENQ